MNPIGYIDEVTRFHISGWAADLDDLAATMKVALSINGHEVATVDSAKTREGLDKIAPGATGRYAFLHYFESPLSPHISYEVSARIVGSDYMLQGDTPTSLSSIKGLPYSRNFRPSVPILLSTMGRSGSTALMAILSQHPKIVVAGRRPFEVEMGCYYAYALRVMTAAGDQAKSLRSDRITADEHRFHLGFNPYFEPSFSTYFQDRHALPQFINDRVAPRLAAAFSEIMLDYYETVAADQHKDAPIFFAEKTLPERDARLGIRAMFPSCREIVLVRDLRDALCSFMAYGKLSFDDALSALQGSTARFLEIVGRNDPSIHLIRYEDFILDQGSILSRLSQFLGISEFAPEERQMAGLFGAHATAYSPSASIGRWKRDLSADQMDRCASLRDALETLGY